MCIRTTSAARLLNRLRAGLRRRDMIEIAILSHSRTTRWYRYPQPSKVVLLIP